MTNSGPVLLDNTVLTNFALVGRPDLVFSLWGAKCMTTTAVMSEYKAGVISRGLPADSWKGLVQWTLHPAEQAFADGLPPQLGAGERSCIAVAVHHQALFASDDAKARQEAKRHGIAVTGTLGIMVLSVRQGLLSLDEGNAILAEMIAQGYRSPVATLDNLL